MRLEKNLIVLASLVSFSFGSYAYAQDNVSGRILAANPTLPIKVNDSKEAADSKSSFTTLAASKNLEFHQESKLVYEDTSYGLDKFVASQDLQVYIPQKNYVAAEKEWLQPSQVQIEQKLSKAVVAEPDYSITQIAPIEVTKQSSKDMEKPKYSPTTALQEINVVQNNSNSQTLTTPSYNLPSGATILENSETNGSTFTNDMEVSLNITLLDGTSLEPEYLTITFKNNEDVVLEGECQGGYTLGEKSGNSFSHMENDTLHCIFKDIGNFNMANFTSMDVSMSGSTAFTVNNYRIGFIYVPTTDLDDNCVAASNTAGECSEYVPTLNLFSK